MARATIEVSVFLVMAEALKETGMPFLLLSFKTMQPVPIMQAARQISVSGMALHVANESEYHGR